VDWKKRRVGGWEAPQARLQMGHVPFFLPPAPGQYSSHCSTLQNHRRRLSVSICPSQGENGGREAD
jgi:hypothetical protein